MQVLELLAADRTSAQIAHALQLQPDTVYKYVKSACLVYGVHSRAAAIAAALRAGHLR